MHGSWENFVGFNAPLYSRSGESGDQAQLNVDWAVSYWINGGMAADKIVLGLATYGHSFTLANPSLYVPGSPATGAGAQGPVSQFFFVSFN